MYQGSGNYPPGVNVPGAPASNPQIINGSMPYNPQQHQQYMHQQHLHQQQMQQHPHASSAYHLQQPQQNFMPESIIKLKRLDDINASIAKISQIFIQFFDEINKDKQLPAKLKQAKNIFEEALKSLKKIETDLLAEIAHINMSSTGHPHEGSIYGAKKDYDLSKMQLSLITAQLNSLRDALNSPNIPKDFYDEDDDDEDDSDDNNTLDDAKKQDQILQATESINNDQMHTNGHVESLINDITDQNGTV